MKRKALCRLAASLLSIEMAFTGVFSCHAAEIGFGAQSTEIGSGVQPPEIGSGAQPAAENFYMLEANRKQISFGSVEQGGLVPHQDIVLCNSGMTDIRLSWQESDYHDCIIVDAPGSDYLKSGDSCTFTIKANTALEPGTYSAFLSFGDVGDPCYEHGIQVNISMTVDRPVPAPPEITSVSVSPETVIAGKGSSCAFTASVNGKNDFSREVVWSVSGQTSRSTVIDHGGILNVGADETAAVLTVKAVSGQDGRYSAVARVSLLSSSYFIQVKASPDNGGSVYGSGTVKEGGNAVLSAAPHNGFEFDGWWQGNNRVSPNSQYVVENIHSDGTYVARFKPVSCRINVAVNNTNAGTASESRTIGYGESITIHAVPRDGYQFDGWAENGRIISTDSKMQLNNVANSRNFTAIFSQNKFTLSLACSPANMGSVSGQGVYPRGSNITLKAAPIQGYRFAGWSENGKVVSTNREYSVNNLSRDMYLVALFEKEQAKTYVIQASVSSPDGIITPEGKSIVSEGMGIYYTIVPKSGFTVGTVYVDGRSVGAVSSYSFMNVQENHVITADFKEIPKSGTDGVTAESSGPNGTLQYLNISLEEAEKLIDENDDMELMTGALQTGDLMVTIHNDFASVVQETAHNSFYENASVTNFGAVLDRILTREEKMRMLQGNHPIMLNLHIDDTRGEESQRTVRLFEEKKLRSMEIGQYFDMFLLESEQDETRMISEIPEKLNVVINVPAHLKADDREFLILRLHEEEDGSLEYTELMDEDQNPDTISFSTDRFSPYAIAYIDWQPQQTESGEETGKIDTAGEKINAEAIAAVIFGVIVTLLGLLYLLKRKRNRKHR